MIHVSQCQLKNYSKNHWKKVSLNMVKSKEGFIHDVDGEGKDRKAGG